MAAPASKVKGSIAPPKSILKKPIESPAVAAPPGPPASEQAPLPREQQIAIAQAQLLLRQRGEEIKPPVPLEVYERLSQFPTVRESSLFSAASPSPDDAREFIETVADFMPREYMDLIEERNCLGNCGYTLCPRPRRNYIGEFRILPSGIAKTADLNMWCSDECARRALFIKVQLENPSYSRKDGKMLVKIELREENQIASGSSPKPSEKKPDEVNRLAHAMGQIYTDKKQTARDAMALATERGDTQILGRQIDVTIREKILTVPAKAPDPDDEAHLMVEGHKPTFRTDYDEDESDDDFLPSAIRM
ncbi:hypothetical protein OQA88_11153 [Cercophora sp. LCS_1]